MTFTLTSVLTLVASDKPLSAVHLAEIENFAEKHGILVTGQPHWLNTHKAADIQLAEPLTLEQMKELHDIFAHDRIDIFCTLLNNRRKKLLVADMDSTIVTSETLDELADEAGLKDKISHITERAMRGELDFQAALKERVGLLKGLPASALKRTLDKTVISKGAETLVKTMQKHGAFCVLVSGGFTYFTGDIANKTGFDAHHGNLLHIEDDKLTGEVGEPILDKDAKLRLLEYYCEEKGIDKVDTVAIGDGANDLPMLMAAGLGLGYYPKPILEKNLLNCIRFTDLTSVLYTQGYSSKDF